MSKVFGSAPAESSNSSDLSNASIGNIMLLMNVIAMSFYYILTKPLLASYPPVAVAAWAYAIAAVCMGFTAFSITQGKPEDWNLPPVIWGPLIYWIFVCSVGGYYILAWSIKHMPSSEVSEKLACSY